MKYENSSPSVCSNWILSNQVEIKARKVTYSQSDFFVWSICNSLERHHNLPLHHHFHRRGFQVFIQNSQNLNCLKSYVVIAPFQSYPSSNNFCSNLTLIHSRIAFCRCPKILQLNIFTWIVKQWRDWSQELLQWDCECHYLALQYLWFHSRLNIARNKREAVMDQQQELLTFTQKLSNNVTRYRNILLYDEHILILQDFRGIIDGLWSNWASTKPR